VSEGGTPVPAITHVPPHAFEGPRGRYRIRAAGPADEDGLRRMLEATAPDDIRLRFFRYVRCFPHELVEPLTRMDDRRHFAFVAEMDGPGRPIVGSAMLVVEPDGRAAEFGIIVARSEANQRLGSHLLDCLIREGRGHGLGTIYGLILADNAGMIDLARRLGFGIACDLQEPGCIRATLRLEAPQ
jgi:acetyltransferase